MLCFYSSDAAYCVCVTVKKLFLVNISFVTILNCVLLYFTFANLHNPTVLPLVTSN